jgi:hypothetical protein
MISFQAAAGSFWRAVSGLLRNRRDTAPIDSVAGLKDFAGSRSAYIAQKTLYGYVKTRMGIRYPAMFEDEQIIASLNIAKIHIFAGCLSDLTVYAVAVGLHGQPVGDEERLKLARYCYESALRENAIDAPEPFSEQASIEEFNLRLADTDWQNGALRSENFTASPKALYRWAPIAPELKRLDAEIVENSIKYAWRDIREQFNNRIDGAAVYADWLPPTGSN